MPSAAAIRAARWIAMMGSCDQIHAGSVEKIAARIDFEFGLGDPLTDALEECRALAGFGDGVVHAIAARRDVIVSQCMTCSRLYRCVSAAGAPGGISSGWCSDQCAPRVPEPTDTPMELEEA
jgi:hypothetical protein